MSERVSRTILLCEDDSQERLVRAYFKICGLNTEPPFLMVRNASREVHGGNVGWVIREFPRELEACRRRHAAQANTLLIVVADADHYEVEVRKRHLFIDSATSTSDPLAVLIPRRNVETWLRAAIGHSVNELDDYKHQRPGLRKPDFKTAARQVYDWARDRPQPDLRDLPSLLAAFPEWRKIG